MLLPCRKVAVADAAGPASTRSTLYGFVEVQDRSCASPSRVHVACTVPPTEYRLRGPGCGGFGVVGDAGAAVAVGVVAVDGGGVSGAGAALIALVSGVC